MTNVTTRAALEKWLHELEQMARARGFAVVHWGRSGDFPLLGLVRPAATPGAPRVYLSAGIHGDEPAGPHAVQHLLRDDLLERQISWTICPLLNPGGWLSGTRETPDGIDLNRDYRDPRSPEAAAHRTWIDTQGPHDLYLSFHEDWETTGFYLYEINTSGHPSFAHRILENVAQIMPVEPLSSIDDHIFHAPGYIAHPPEPDEPLNWPEAIYHAKSYPHLSYTFETPSSLALADRVQAHIVATRTAVAEFLARST